ncbi:MAG: hypothetical protein WCG87_00630 [Bacteroidota bacterium]
MKKIIFILLAVLPFVANAQKYEATLGGGISINGQPGDNEPYKGDKTVVNYAVMLNVMQNFGKYNWQAGVQYNALPMINKSSKTYPAVGNPNRFVGGNDQKFIYSSLTNAVCFVANKKFNLADLKMNEHGSFKIKGTIYAGISLGFAMTKNSNAKDTTDKSVAYKAPDGGIGPVTGLQFGYSYPISSRLSANIDLGIRYYYIYFTAQAPTLVKTSGDIPNLHFGLLAYPITIGVKYNFYGLTRAQKKMDEAKKAMAASSSEKPTDAMIDVEGQ